MARPLRLETPLLTARRLVTVALLCTSLVIVLVAQQKFGRPGTWRWVTGEAASAETLTDPTPNPPRQPSLAIQSELTRVSLLVGQASLPCLTPAAASLGTCGSCAAEYVPLSTTQQATVNRRAPYPNSKQLAGAADGEPFLYPATDALPELQASTKAAADANGRYHLLQLAQDALPGSLEADARNDIRYEALRQKPEEFRGELITLTGTLVSLAPPMELHGKLPGLEVCYLGHVVGERPEHRYLILFTDLPPALGERQKDWGQLFVPGVTFSGYFYKVAKFTQPAGKRREWSMPVLVGKSPQLPPVVAENNWSIILVVFIIMAVPVVLVGLVLPRFFRRGEVRHRRLMEHLRSRHEERVRQALEPPTEPPPPEPKIVPSDQISRLREGLSPTEWN